MVKMLNCIIKLFYVNKNDIFKPCKKNACATLLLKSKKSKTKRSHDKQEVSSSRPFPTAWLREK